MPEIKRVGILGCGFFAQNHINAWSDLRAHGVEIVALCDTDLAKARRASQEFGGEPYDNAAVMFATASLDLVDIVTQVRSHRSLAELAINAGVHPIVQKPFASSLRDCRAITELSRVRGIPLAVKTMALCEAAYDSAALKRSLAPQIS